MRWRAAARREAVTDDDGRFVLTQLHDAEQYVNAWCEGYRVARADPEPRTVRPGAAVDFVATRVREVGVVVRRPDGPVEEEVHIDFRRSGPRGGSWGMVWTSETPSVLLEQGEWTASVRWNRESDFEPVSATITVPAAGPVPGVDLVLQEATRLTGRVLLRDGEEWDRVAVWLVRALPGTENAARESRDRSHIVTTRAPENGFRIGDLEPGRYVAFVSPDSRIAAWQQVVDVVEGANEVDLDVGGFADADTLVIEVLDEEGRRLRQVRFSLIGRHPPSGRSGGGALATTRSDGTHAIFFGGGAGGGLDEGWDYWIEVKVPGHGTQEVPFRPGIDRHLVARFGRPAELHVTLVGYPTGFPDEHLSLALVPRGADELQVSFAAHMHSDDELTDGEWRSGPVSPGEYALILRAGEHLGHVIARTELTLGAGATEHVLAPPPLHGLTVRVAPEWIGKKVYLASARSPVNASGSLVAEVDGDARVQFAAAMPGPYVVGMHDGEVLHEMLVRLPDDRDVVFQETRLNGLLVTSVEPGGYMDSHGFLPRDVIVAIDGVEFSTSGEAAKALGRNASKDTRAILVLRSGRPVGLSVEGARFNGRTDVGGSWEPTSR